MDSLGAAGLAAFLALGAPFFWLVRFFAVVVSGATSAPFSAAVAVYSVLMGSFFMVVVLFCAGFAHDDPSLRFGTKASQIPRPIARVHRALVEWRHGSLFIGARRESLFIGGAKRGRAGCQVGKRNRELCA
jgi:hypothetical protein